MRRTEEGRMMLRQQGTGRKHRLLQDVLLSWGALLSGLICISVLITSIWGTELSDAVSSGEGFLSRSFQRITGSAQQSLADGHVSSGNNYRTGDPQLEVTVLEQPTETLYLKGFSGGEYTGGDWDPADDQAVFEAMAQTLNWDSWESWISGMYYSLYFSMNEMTSWNETARDGTAQNETVRFGETDGARFSGGLWLDAGRGDSCSGWKLSDELSRTGCRCAE